MSSELSTDASSAQPTSSRGVSPWAVVAGIALLAAAGLRLRGIFNDLWFDEIWSIDRMRQAGSPGAIFSTIHHDNNHYLNTLWLYCVGGDHGNWPGYRLLSLLSGVGAIVMAGLIARPRGWLAVAVTILVFGFSTSKFSMPRRREATPRWFSSRSPPSIACGGASIGQAG